MPHFVSTDWLNEQLNDPGIVIIDASWYLPNAGRDAVAEFEASHIPGAVHFNFDEIADTATVLPHMLPDDETFSRMVGALGIGSDKTIIVYDEPGLFSAPRVWWTLRVMGAGDVRILEGGGTKWRSEGRPLASGSADPQPADFIVKRDTNAIADFDTVLAAIGSGSQILDARPAARFSGTAPEPRAGLKSGHMPGAANLPFSDLVENGSLKSPDAIEAAIRATGIDPRKPVITTCGSGVTAAVLALALDVIGAPDVKLYDGSWSEWGARDDAPVKSA